MQKKDICDFTKFMGFLSKKWVFMIIKSISDGCKSYTEIEKNLVWVNPRILSNRLKELQKIGFVEKKTLSKTPRRCIYCLTDRWVSLWTQIENLSKWIEDNFDCKLKK